MSFKESNVTVRMGVRDAAYRLGKLAELLTLGHSPLTDEISADMDKLATKMMANLELAGYKDVPPAGEARIKNGDTVTTVSSDTSSLSVPATATVTGNALSNVKLSVDTDAIVQDGADISIQDRNSVTLLGSGVRARVARGGLISAYFTGLLNAVQSDGNPLDITTARGGSTVTGRVRAYVTGNVVRNVYLDGTAALQTGASVPVQNSAGLNIQPGTVTVASNAVQSVRLPASYTAFGNGISHPVVDRNGVSANAVAAVANGSLTSQTLEAGVALVTSTSIAAVPVRDNQSRSSVGLKPTFADGKLTEFVMPDYTALVKNNMYPTFVLTYDGKSPESGDAALTAQVSQAGGLSMLLPKSAVVITSGGKFTTLEGKTYSTVISNGKMVALTEVTAS